MTLAQLISDRPYVTDGGLETTLVFRDGHRPRPTSPPSRCSTTSPVARRCAATTRRTSTSPTGSAPGIVLDTPTWRANLDWGARLGYDAARLAAVNRRAVEFVADAGRVSDRRSHHGAQRRHRPTRRRLRRRGDDVAVGGRRLPRPAGPGLRRGRRRHDQRHHDDLRRRGDRRRPRRQRRVGLPAVISFTVETDGRLPSGQSLGEAITAGRRRHRRRCRPTTW